MTFHLAADIGFLIHRASRLLQVELQKALEPYDLTREQWPVLAMLWDEEGVSQNKIGAYLCKDQPTITRIIDRLEKKRLVKRVTNTRDRRALAWPGRRGNPRGEEIADLRERPALAPTLEELRLAQKELGGIHDVAHPVAEEVLETAADVEASPIVGPFDLIALR